MLFVTYSGLIARARATTPTRRPRTTLLPPRPKRRARGRRASPAPASPAPVAGPAPPAPASQAAAAAAAPAASRVDSRFEQICSWMEKARGGDGLLVFDEAHKARSAGGDEEENSQTSRAVTQLQQRLGPRA